MASYLLPFVTSYRKELTKGRRKSHRRYISKFKPKYPLSAEKTYKKALNTYMKGMFKALNIFLDNNYNNWVSTYNRDAEQTDLKDFIDTYLHDEYGIDDDYISNFLVAKANQIDAFNIDDFARFVGAVIGTDKDIAKVIIPSLGEYGDKLLDDWVLQNKSLWKNVSDDFVTKVTSIVHNNVINGVSIHDTKKEVLKVLPKRHGLPDYNRADLIARDQTAKFNSILDKARMEDAELHIYEWLVVFDERLRGNPSGKFPNANPRHDIMHGKYCKWNDSNKISDDKGKTWRNKKGKEERLHAGMAIRCRCMSVGVVTEILDLSDKELENFF